MSEGVMDTVAALVAVYAFASGLQATAYRDLDLFRAPYIMAWTWPLWVPFWLLVKLPRVTVVVARWVAVEAWRLLTRYIPTTAKNVAADLPKVLRP